MRLFAPIFILLTLILVNVLTLLTGKLQNCSIANIPPLGGQ